MPASMDFYDPEVRARLTDHWNAVLAGLHKPAEHIFRDHAGAVIESRAEVHRLRARMLIEAAGAEMRAARLLAEASTI